VDGWAHRVAIRRDKACLATASGRRQHPSGVPAAHVVIDEGVRAMQQVGGVIQAPVAPASTTGGTFNVSFDQSILKLLVELGAVCVQFLDETMCNVPASAFRLMKSGSSSELSKRTSRQ
jgi:hypothetical protein